MKLEMTDKMMIDLRAKLRSVVKVLLDQQNMLDKMMKKDYGPEI
jgi:hypothetical protein